MYSTWGSILPQIDNTINWTLLFFCGFLIKEKRTSNYWLISNCETLTHLLLINPNYIKHDTISEVTSIPYHAKNYAKNIFMLEKENCDHYRKILSHLFHEC